MKPSHDHCRPPLARMLDIHTQLQEKKYPNCSSLARKHEKSVRTLVRDIEFMRDSLRLPIEWCAANNGYYYSEPVKQFPLVSITEAEIFALGVAQKAIAQYHGTPFQKPLGAAFRKLLGQLDQGARFSIPGVEELLSFRVSGPDDSDLKTFEVLTGAMRERRVIKILHRTRATLEAKERLVHPYHMTCVDNHWYLWAFDLNRKKVLTFALKRMEKAELGRGTFKKPKNFNAQRRLKNSFGIFTSDADGDYEVVIDFDVFAADEVRGRHWHVPWDTTELKTGWLRLRLRLANLEEVERWVLSFGDHAEVVGPQALKDRLAQKAEFLRRCYGKTEPAPMQGALPICDGCLGQFKQGAIAKGDGT